MNISIDSMIVHLEIDPQRKNLRTHYLPGIVLWTEHNRQKSSSSGVNILVKKGGKSNIIIINEKII